MAPVLKETEQHRGSISFAEPFDGFIESGSDPFPGIIGSRELLHFKSLLLASLTPLLCPNRASGYKPGRAKQPPGQHHAVPQAARFPRQQNEDGLTDFFGQLRIVHLPQRGREHEVEVSANERAKRGF